MNPISIDRAVCYGSGECVLDAPDVFVLDDSGVATMLTGAELNLEAARRIAENCPSGAMRLARPDRGAGPTDLDR